MKTRWFRLRIAKALAFAMFPGVMFLGTGVLFVLWDIVHPEFRYDFPILITLGSAAAILAFYLLGCLLLEQSMVPSQSWLTWNQEEGDCWVYGRGSPYLEYDSNTQTTAVLDEVTTSRLFRVKGQVRSHRDYLVIIWIWRGYQSWIESRDSYDDVPDLLNVHMGFGLTQLDVGWTATGTRIERRAVTSVTFLPSNPDEDTVSFDLPLMLTAEDFHSDVIGTIRCAIESAQRRFG